jgi:hypothetical protein
MGGKEMIRITTPDLDKVDFNKLDSIEQIELSRLLSKGMKKEHALQVIINTTEGDFTQLSDELREKAERDITWK